MIRPGMPTAVAPAGTALVTTALEPILAPAPTVNGPSTLAPAPTTTPSSRVGWRLPLFQLVPPRVTPWYRVTSSPISAVSPITMPMPWSMKKRRPTFAPG
ncbi:hypothetical protein D3C77_691450 [compost metagenome]